MIGKLLLFLSCLILIENSQSITELRSLLEPGIMRKTVEVPKSLNHEGMTKYVAVERSSEQETELEISVQCNGLELEAQFVVVTASCTKVTCEDCYVIR